MQYREFGKTGVKVSAFGFGCMRFPTVGGDEARIDEPEAIRMLRHAIDNGVNYVDTAYPYHGGGSEVLVGKALSDGYREKVYLATKSPVWNIKEPDDFDRLLAVQLERLQTDHIDFYLLHALSKNRWDNIVLKFGLLEKMRQAKADGRIRHIGFSFHDDYETFCRIIDGFDGWEFCQVQYNYVDVENQATRKGIQYAGSKGLGVVVMEPVRGGRLADPPKQVAKVLPDKKSPVEWALDFVWNEPEVGPVLSGVSTFQQTVEDLEYASRSSVGMLSAQEAAMFEEARRIYETMAFVPCTRCAYCMPCPFGLDIPKLYEAYNLSATASKEEAQAAYVQLEPGADACKTCNQCRKSCPQDIDPAEYMPQVAAFFSGAKKPAAV